MNSAKNAENRNKFRSVLHRIILTYPLTSCPQRLLNLLSLMGVFFTPASVLKKNICSSYICCCMKVTVSLSQCAYPCASVHVRMPFVSETERVCSIRITYVVSRCSPVTQTLSDGKRKQEKSTGVSMSCPIAAHSLGLIGLIHHCMEMDFHPKKRTFIFLSVCLLVVLSRFLPAPFSISSVCAE